MFRFSDRISKHKQKMRHAVYVYIDNEFDLQTLDSYRKTWSLTKFQVTYFTPKDCAEFIYKHTLRDLSEEDKLIANATLTSRMIHDIWRWGILWEYGGVYTLLGIEPCLYIQDFIEKGFDSVLCMEEDGITISDRFVMAPAKSCSVKECLDRTIDHLFQNRGYSWKLSLSFIFEDNDKSTSHEIYDTPFGTIALITCKGSYIEFQNQQCLIMNGQCKASKKPYNQILYFESFHNTFSQRVMEGLELCANSVNAMDFGEALPHGCNVRNEVIKCDLCVIWNGYQIGDLFVIDLCKKFDIPYLIIEQGLIDQANNFVLDKTGICGASTSITDTRVPSPEAVRRFEDHYKSRDLLRNEAKVLTNRVNGKKKYLIVLQLIHDTTVYHTSSFMSMSEFVDTVYADFDAPGIEFVICKHPKDPGFTCPLKKNMRFSTESTIRESLDAELAIAISSGVLYEILGTGCPVHTYAKNHPLTRNVKDPIRLVQNIMDTQIPHIFTTQDFVRVVSLLQLG